MLSTVLGSHGWRAADLSGPRPDPEVTTLSFLASLRAEPSQGEEKPVPGGEALLPAALQPQTLPGWG